MSAERLLQICVASMAALATLLLGTSQDSGVLPVIAVAAAAGSLLFTDVLGWLHLHRYVAGALGVVAVFNTFLQLQGAQNETQFISVANLLIYLQIILLFQSKHVRIYWQIIVLSLLQVVVAAALNLFFLFGPLLVMYAVLACAALLLLNMIGETKPYLRSADSRRTTAAVEDQNESSVIQVEGPRSGPRLHVAGCSDASPQREILRRGLARHLGLLCLSTAIVAAGVFCLMPRFGNGVWRARPGQQQTGYSESVDLDDVGSIFESPSVVMRVSFVDEWNGKPYPLSTEPYYRGGVLNRYRDGRWQREQNSSRKRLNPPERLVGVVRQNFSMERQRGGVVFSVSPACRLENTPENMEVNPGTHEIAHKPKDDEDPAQYSVGTTALRNGLQSEFIPKLRSISFDSADRSRVVASCPKLTALAEEIVAAADLEPGDRLGRARALEAHFSRSGLYRYSLNPSPDRNPGVDPVEDFVSNHRTGHCQYFASALTLMLRSQNIPARVVVGYRGGAFNVVGNYYQVRELDAHAWVEALLLRRHIPQDEVLPTEGLDGDAWVRLDPTPGDGGILRMQEASQWTTQLNDAIDYMQLLWSEYVLGLNQKRQRKAIYEPIQNAFRALTDYCFSRQQWAARWQAFQEHLQGGFFNRRTALDAAAAALVLTVLYAALRMSWRIVRRCWRLLSTGRGAARQSRVEFYRRFEALLARHGLRRRQDQTQREFADVVAAHLRGPLGQQEAASAPVDIVALYYRVRFGRDALGGSDRRRLESLFQQLQQALARGPQR